MSKGLGWGSLRVRVTLMGMLEFGLRLSVRVIFSVRFSVRVRCG